MPPGGLYVPPNGDVVVGGGPGPGGVDGRVGVAADDELLLLLLLLLAGAGALSLLVAGLVAGCACSLVFASFGVLENVTFLDRLGSGSA